MRASFAPPLVLLAALSLARCECAEPAAPARCDGGPCDDGGALVDGGAPADSGLADAGDLPPGDAGPCDDDCPDGARCYLQQCTTDLGPCATGDDCGSDSACTDEGFCAPFGEGPVPPTDATCRRSIDIEAIAPQVQCSWSGPPVGDAVPDHVHVMSTPIVVDLDLDLDEATLAPSIVFTTFPTAGSYGAPGVLRVVDGATCAQQASLPLPEDAVMSPAGPAAGDLDGDGRAEIVAAAHGGGLLAFRVDPTTGELSRLWRSGACDASGGRAPDATGGPDQWSGPSLHDLDDDGAPEVIYGATVYGADGCLRSQSPSFPAYSRGLVPVVADVDEDGAPELVTGASILAWDASISDLVPEAYFLADGLAEGQVAVADFGAFPVASLGGRDVAEIAVVSASTVRVQLVDGTVVFGPHPIPGGGTGGPPTIADFDGDGRVEVATAGGAAYAVFDLDCTAGGDPAGCGGQSRTDGVLWQQPSQDQSSNVTGSSIFDFDADGRAEAVYADECYLRIYDGTTGEVRYSASRSSGTTYENPVIADVDGDFRTEIVTSVNDYASISCPATDPLLPTSTYAPAHGVVVLRDVLDRWAASRPIWNQHAYAVTHVDDRGRIPRSSEVAANWRAPGLNNFRQNVQGDLDALGVADLTAAGAGPPTPVLCGAEPSLLEARVCNRGLLPVGAGAVVSYRQGAPDGPELCSTTLQTPLQPGACGSVSCAIEAPSSAIDVYVVVDPADGFDECREGNNVGVLRGVSCFQPGG